MNSNRISAANARNFIQSGKARVIFHTKKPIGPRDKYMYFIRWKERIGTWYVYSDPMNYIGAFNASGGFFPIADYNLRLRYEQEIRVFIWVWQNILDGTLPEHIHILHTGICGRCSRTLTDPESIELGIGPECRRKIGAAALKAEHA